MKFDKSLLVEEVSKGIVNIQKGREKRWVEEYDTYVKETNKKFRWFWQSRIEPVSFNEYKDNWGKYGYNAWLWSPDEYYIETEGAYNEFLSHCAKDLDPQYIYLSSTDINFYRLNSILRRLYNENRNDG